MTDDIYGEARQFLDGLPGGYPATGNGVEINTWVLKSAERPAEEIRASFRATIDSDRCNGYAVCLDPCQIGAIVEADEALAPNVAGLLSEIAERRAVS